MRDGSGARVQTFGPMNEAEERLSMRSESAGDDIEERPTGVRKHPSVRDIRTHPQKQHHIPSVDHIEPAFVGVKVEESPRASFTQNDGNRESFERNSDKL